MKAFDNYVIFREHKLIYAAIPKAANSAMKKCLIPLLGVADPMSGYHRRTGLFEYCQKREVIKRKDFLRFTLVRDPWSRIYSCWHEKVRKKLHPPIAKMKYQGVYEGMPFTDFVKAVADIPDERSNAHFRSQYSLITHQDGLIVDLIMPLEKIQLLHKLVEGYTQTKLGPLTERNTSSANAYLSAYTNETIDLIYKRFQKEIDLFGFEFGGTEKHSKPPAMGFFNRLRSKLGRFGRDP